MARKALQSNPRRLRAAAAEAAPAKLASQVKSRVRRRRPSFRSLDATLNTRCAQMCVPSCFTNHDLALEAAFAFPCFARRFGNAATGDVFQAAPAAPSKDAGWSSNAMPTAANGHLSDRHISCALAVLQREKLTSWGSLVRDAKVGAARRLGARKLPGSEWRTPKFWLQFHEAPSAPHLHVKFVVELNLIRTCRRYTIMMR
eukprot:scaffold309_cov235-Pinguiococcus_pyrenoidosus.AAC.16